MRLIEINMSRIIALCKKYRVARLWVFGSVLTHRFNENSDVDFLVDFDDSNIPLPDYADNFFDFIKEMEKAIGRKIDLVVNKTVHNKYFRQELDETKVLIYGA